MANDDEEVLAELLKSDLSSALDLEDQAPTRYVNEAATPTEAKAEKKEEGSHSQWALGGNGKFMPVGATVSSLRAGVYTHFSTPTGWGLEIMKVMSDGIYTLPDMATETVLNEVNKFWSSESRYREHSLLYKRGVLLWGPPGSGKSVTVKLLMNELVRRGGIVVVASNIGLTIECLKAIRRIEGGRNLIVVLEDLDEIIRYNGESVVLSMLDGEDNIDNVLHLATTNFPERLGSRIINRPSRFDRRIRIGMPGAPARMEYLLRATKEGLSQEDLNKWVEDTEGLSIAHLRELVAAVYCLDQPYDQVMERLLDMQKQIKDEEELTRGQVGFSFKSNVAKPMIGRFISSR